MRCCLSPNRQRSRTPERSNLPAVTRTRTLLVATLGALRDTLEWRLGAVYNDEPGSGVSAACTLLCARWPILIDPLRVA